MYQFVNVFWVIGLLGGGIPWAMFFRSSGAKSIALGFQGICLAVAVGNLLYGLFVIYV